LARRSRGGRRSSGREARSRWRGRRAMWTMFRSGGRHVPAEPRVLRVERVDPTVVRSFAQAWSSSGQGKTAFPRGSSRGRWRRRGRSRTPGRLRLEDAVLRHRPSASRSSSSAPQATGDGAEVAGGIRGSRVLDVRGGTSRSVTPARVSLGSRQ
jgi:hypothetical protein